MLVEQLDLQLLRPPIAIGGAGDAGGGIERAFGFGGHRFIPS
jgi:hypothetical protein